MNIVTLTNGKRVGNFSSPHPFTFEDGTVLPAVSDKKSIDLSVEFLEYDLNDKGDIELHFSLTSNVIREIKAWKIQHSLNKIDVVFCPLPMITALRHLWGKNLLIKSPFRAIRCTDRISKQVSINKQCI